MTLFADSADVLLPKDLHTKPLPFGGKPLEYLPRFRALAIHIRSALYGYRSEQVQHMVERNEAVDLMRQVGTDVPVW